MALFISGRGGGGEDWCGAAWRAAGSGELLRSDFAMSGTLVGEGLVRSAQLEV